MSVSNIDIDIVDYSGKKDFQVINNYISEKKFTVTVKRLDAKEGWNENISVFINFKSLNQKLTINIGSSTVQHKIVEVETGFSIERDDNIITELSDYSLSKANNIQRISRSKFNEIFSSELVILPTFLFAVGFKNGVSYIYNESYDHLYMIEQTINRILSIALTKKTLRIFYFVINASDGYMENHYGSLRNKPCLITDEECKGKKQVNLTENSEYPVFHKNEYILAQSNQNGISKTINMPDRYYYCMNLYNEYRSFHKGIPFPEKMSVIVFASNLRGSKYNFKNRRDIELSQREYFYSDAVPKDNIYAPNWVEKEDMVKYKYILDIDGHASTWDATAWKLNSGSVILKSESIWSQWFYDGYKEWVHYVPIKDDFSDIQEKYRWCESNQEQCETMIENCKRLFQETYRHTNVIKYIEDQIYNINDLYPYFANNKRLFFLSKKINDGIIKTTKLSEDELLKSIKGALDKLNDDDIIIYFNSSDTDINNFDPLVFYNKYLNFEKKIVFGAEQNVWPEDILPLKNKMTKISPLTSKSKYLNAGFFCAEVGEMRRLLDEQVFEGPNFIEQAYFTKILLQNTYSMCLDYSSSLVTNTYMYSNVEIEDFKRDGTPFIHFNAGRIY